MADFCTVCANDMGFNTNIKIEKEFNKLKNGYFINCLCEGCTLDAIGKSETGELILGKYEDDRWFTKEEHFKEKAKGINI
ncbi:hypothetical protein H8D85_02360 [bacterium]|nr:hypothetical protein [bacterium]